MCSKSDMCPLLFVRVAGIYQIARAMFNNSGPSADAAAVQAKPLPAVARPYMLASYCEHDVLGDIDGGSFLA